MGRAVSNAQVHRCATLATLHLIGLQTVPSVIVKLCTFRQVRAYQLLVAIVDKGAYSVQVHPYATRVI